MASKNGDDSWDWELEDGELEVAMRVIVSTRTVAGSELCIYGVILSTISEHGHYIILAFVHGIIIYPL